MALADRDPVGRQIAAPLPRTALLAGACRPIGALAPFLRRRFRHQELFAVAALQRQRRGDIGHRHVVITLVGLDELAEQLDTRRRQRRGDRVAELRHPLLVDVVDRRQLRFDELLPGHPLDGVEQVTLARCDEQQRGARPPRAPGPSDAVHVGLGIVRDVVVQNMGDAFDVQPARRDVGGDQDVGRAVLERVDRSLADRLRNVAVDGGRREPAGTQLLGHLFGGLLGAHEDDHRLEGFDLEQARQRIHLARPGHLHVALRDVLGGLGLRLDRHLHRVVQVLGGDLADARRHRGREQRDLLVLRGVRQDAFHVLGETHLQHLVGLVEHQVVQVREVQAALLEMVDDPPGGADHDLRAALETGQLGSVGAATVDGQHVDPQMRAVTAERLGDLQRQFPRRGEHQRLGGAAVGVDLRQDRDRERGRLTGSGLGETHHIRALEHRGNGGGLDR